MKRLLTISNALTILRAPLALLFLSSSTSIRLLALFFAMFTDCLDGYIARKRRTTSQLGAVLDPIMDKFFVFFVLSILFQENQISLWQVCAMLSRDFFLCIFALYLSLFHLWDNYKYKSIWWGKINTSLQFFLLMGLTLGFSIPSAVYTLFILTGCLAFIQLLKLRSAQEIP